MKKKFISNLKCVISIVIYVFCVFILFQQIGFRYQQAASHNVINAFTQKRFEDFYNLPKNSLNMVFIGSSHAYCTFDPENFDSYFNIYSYQMGTPLQHLDTSYYELREIYNTQNPDVVVLEIYWDVLDDTFEMKQANSFFEVLQNEELKKEYIKKVFPLGEKVKYYLLPMKFQQDYFAYETNQIEKKLEEKYGLKKKKIEYQKGEEYYRSKGYVYCDMGMLPGEYNETNQFKSLDGKYWELDDTQSHYVKKIAELCREKGSELVLVTAPVALVSMDYIKNYDMIHNKVAELAKQIGANYIDYNIVNQQIPMLTNDNFRDDAHLNDSGVQIVDRHFRNWLTENTAFFNKYRQ